ncbi:MAG TPA: hypothetical protein VOA87_09765 [Thermoanaerobaculia bacterium]|nr:hypothetical protein [Thermoanaerobaculia bacterium]
MRRGLSPAPSSGRASAPSWPLALLPGTGLDRLFRLQPEHGPEGYALEASGEVVGHLLPLRHRPRRCALHTGEAVLQMQDSLSRFLAAGGAVVLEIAGRLLAFDPKAS